MKLQGVMINSDNPKALAEFYTKAFGKPGWEQDDFYGYMVDGGMLMVGPHSEVKGKNESPGRIMISFVTSDVKSDFEKIKTAGGEVVAEPYNPDENSKDLWLGTLADPDGNYLQLSTPWEDAK